MPYDSDDYDRYQEESEEPSLAGAGALLAMVLIVALIAWWG